MTFEYLMNLLLFLILEYEGKNVIKLIGYEMFLPNLSIKGSLFYKPNRDFIGQYFEFTCYFNN